MALFIDGEPVELHGGPEPLSVAIGVPALQVRAEDLPLVLPPKDGEILKSRFRSALLGNGGDS